MNLPVPELKNDGNIKESSCLHSSLSLGPYSDDIDFNISDTNNYKSFCGQKYFQFTNGSMFEIGQYHHRNFTWDHFSLLLATFTGEEKMCLFFLNQASICRVMPKKPFSTHIVYTPNLHTRLQSLLCETKFSKENFSKVLVIKC